MWLTVLTYDLAQRNKVTAPTPRVLSLACMMTTKTRSLFQLFIIYVFIEL